MLRFFNTLLKRNVVIILMLKQTVARGCRIMHSNSVAAAFLLDANCREAGGDGELSLNSILQNSA